MASCHITFIFVLFQIGYWLRWIFLYGLCGSILKSTCSSVHRTTGSFAKSPQNFFSECIKFSFFQNPDIHMWIVEINKMNVSAYRFRKMSSISTVNVFFMNFTVTVHHSGIIVHHHDSLSHLLILPKDSQTI